MNRKTRLYLILSEEYYNCLDPNDPMILFYLDIMDKLWFSFSEKEIEYVEKQIGLMTIDRRTVSKPSTDT